MILGIIKKTYKHFGSDRPQNEVSHHPPFFRRSVKHAL
jgi:hypothetical protein